MPSTMHTRLPGLWNRHHEHVAEALRGDQKQHVCKCAASLHILQMIALDSGFCVRRACEQQASMTDFSMQEPRLQLCAAVFCQVIAEKPLQAILIEGYIKQLICTAELRWHLQTIWSPLRAKHSWWAEHPRWAAVRLPPCSQCGPGLCSKTCSASPIKPLMHATEVAAENLVGTS